MDRSVAHQPFIDQSCAARGGTWGGLAETDTRQGRRGGESAGHSLITWMQSDTQCVYMSMCVCETRKGSVTGHQMVTVWAGPQQAKERGDSLFTPLPLSLSLLLSHTHTLTCIQQTMRVMADNGADTNKSAPLGQGP